MTPARRTGKGGGSASRRPLTGVDVVAAAVERRNAMIGKAHAEFRAAVVAAHDGGRGLSAREVAEAAGLTRQRVYQLLEPTDGEIAARIADIRGRWEATVERFAEGWKNQGWERVEQARRNGKARKRARKGLKPFPTVADDRRAYAEKLLLAAIDRQPDHPVFVRVVDEFAEWDRLAALLERRLDRRSGIFS